MIKLPITVTVIFILFSTISCSGPQSTSSTAPAQAPDNPESDEIQKQTQILRRLTDDVLVALASYNYSQLERLIKSDNRQLTGAQAAALLVGSHATTMAIGPWDAQKIDVRLDDQRINATTKVKVTFRLSLNREPQTSLFTFHFSRSNPTESWLLVIQ